MCGGLAQPNWNSPLPARLRRGRRQFFAGGDFALTDRGAALSAEVIENFFIGQN